MKLSRRSDARDVALGAALIAAVLAQTGGAVHAATTRTWDGGGANGFWTNPTNWVGDVAPVAGDALEFPPGAARPINTNNFPASTVFQSVSIGGTGYFLRGVMIVLNAGLAATNAPVTNTVEFPIQLASNQMFNVAGSNSLSQLSLFGPIDTAGHNLTLAGDGGWQVPGVISGAGSLTKLGTNGTAVLYSSNSFDGPVLVQEGTLRIDNGGALGSTNGTTTVLSNGTLHLNGGIKVPQAITLQGALTGSTLANVLDGPILLNGGTVPVSVASGSGLTINGLITGSGGLAKTNVGTLRLNAANTYTGATFLSAGTLGGTGVVSAVTSVGSAGKTIAPGLSPGVLTCSNVMLSASTTVQVELNGTNAGTGYDQLNVHGSVALSNATLSVLPGFTPAVGDSFVIINNDGAEPVTNTFTGLTNGAVFAVGGLPFQINYAGGDGNDVVLTRVAPPASFTFVGLSGSSVLVQGAGVPFANYSLQASSNLSLWLLIATNAAGAGGLYQFLDTDAPLYSNRFYRVTLP